MKVAIYTRVSTDEQAREGYSLENQKEFLEKFAKDNNHEIYKAYVDDGYSGYSLERPALKLLLKDARERKFELILVYKIDRFSRNLMELLNLVVGEFEKKYQIGFRSATEPFSTTTSDGKLMLQQLGAFAEFERNRIKERVFPGMVRGVQLGNWQGSRYSPIGYRYDKDKKVLGVHKEEAKLVKLVYTMYIAGHSTLKIAGYLNSNGYKNREKGKFHSKLIGDILKNKVYLGLLVWNKHHYDKNQKTANGFKYVKNPASKVIEAKGKHKPIITQEEFDKVQEILKKRRKGIIARANAKDYLLTGLIICGKCSHKYQGCLSVASRKHGETTARRRYYRCGGATAYATRCGNSYLRADDVEKEIFRIIEVIANTPFVEDFLTEMIEKDLVKSNSEIDKEFDKYKNLLKGNVSKQKKLTNHSLEGLISDEVFREKCLELKDEENQLKAKLASVRQQIIENNNSINYKKIVAELLRHFEDVKDSLDAAGKKMLLRIVFKNIIVLDGKIKDFELYEPFKTLYAEGKKLWEIDQNVSTCEHTAGRWPIYSKSTHSTLIAVYDDACSGLMMSLAAALVE